MRHCTWPLERMLAHQPNNSAHIAESAVGRSNGLQISLSLSKRTSNPDVRTVWKDDTEGAKVTMVSSAGSMLSENTSALMYRWTCCSRTPPRPSSPLFRRRKNGSILIRFLNFDPSHKVQILRQSTRFSSTSTPSIMIFILYPCFVQMYTRHASEKKGLCLIKSSTESFQN